MKEAAFTVRVLRPNPHREKTQVWRSGQIISAMEGCGIHSILAALTAFEADTRPIGVKDPIRWISQFAGLESVQSGKKVEPWIQVVHQGQEVASTSDLRRLLQTTEH